MPESYSCMKFPAHHSDITMKGCGHCYKKGVNKNSEHVTTIVKELCDFLKELSSQ